MTVAVWIIAICEIIRMLQNLIQLRLLVCDNSARDNAYSEFVKSLKMKDREFVKRMLEEFEENGRDEEE